MKIKTSFYVLIFCISAFSCKKEQNSVDTTPKKYAQLEKANWFLGNWENVTEEMTFKEIWKQEKWTEKTQKQIQKGQKEKLYSIKQNEDWKSRQVR